MTREEREAREGRIARLFAGLERETPTASEQELRSLARNASSRSRPLPSPVRSRRWPLQARSTGLLVLALVVAIGLGIGLGALIAPSGTAAPGPVGTGFLPGPGWTVLQTGSDATPERQALAVATNVPFHPEDSARGIRNSSGLPYSTLLQLPSRGVVIVALFTRRESEPWNDDFFPERELPLRVRDAVNSISYSYQMRPERPLGQYELRVTVGDHRIVLHFYFGTRRPSRELIASAQRQLDRLIVASVSAGNEDRYRRPAASDAASATKVVDRTLVCETGLTGGLHQLSVVASPRIPTLKRQASISATTHFQASVLGSVSEGGWSLGGSCKPSAARVPLSSRSLTVDAVPFEVRYRCMTPRRVLVRARGIFRSPTTIRRGSPYGAPLLFAFSPMREGHLAIRTESGKPLLYGFFVQSGNTQLFVSRTCDRHYQR